MASAENGKMQYEAGQTLVAYATMTNSGDEQTYTLASTVWSGRSGYTPSIRPNGMVSGLNVLSTHASNDKLTVAAFTAYLAGVLTTVTATTATITRGVTADKAQIHSITLASDGSIATIKGTVSASTAFSETRNSAGGPPFIPVTSVEIGQVRLSAATAAVIASTEIFQTVGTHAERYDYPTWTVNNIGLGTNASVAAKKNAYVLFDAALPEIHTGTLPKRVYAQVYTVTFSDVSKSKDFKAPSNTHSVTSNQIYGGTIASSSSSLGQGSFTAYLTDGVSDGLVTLQDETLTFRFYPDENQTPYVLCQGKLGLDISYPVDNQVTAAATISSEVVAAKFTS